LQKIGVQREPSLSREKESSNGAPNDEAEKRRKRADAGARISEIQKRVKPDPEGWTSRDYINDGRR
jgi:hypothetical protein